jgi:hypothetical protein
LSSFSSTEPPLRLGLLLAFVLAVLPRSAESQACCAGAAAGQLGRLALHEEGLVGLDLRGVRTLGTFGDDATYRASGTEALQFEQSLLATVRLGHPAQVGVVLPLVQSYARTRREAGFGGGVGDLQLQARYDFTFAGQSLRVPGIAVVGGLVLPTGRALEETSHPLGVEATGRGAIRASGGLGLEQSFGAAFAQIAGAFTYDAPRTARGRTYDARWGASASFVLGASLPSELTLALSARHEAEPESPRRSWRLGLAAGLPLADWRLQGGLFCDPPFEGFGRNENARLGLHFALMRIWT